MKITLGTLKSAETALKKLLNADLDIKVSLSLRRLVQTVDSELKHFEDERVKLVKRHGKQSETGLTVAEDKLEEFAQDLNVLMDCEVEIPVSPFDISTVEGVKFSAVELFLLEPFFEMEDVKPKLVKKKTN